MLNKDEVMQRIPHRPPILLVDDVVGWDAGKTLHARRTFLEDDPVFEGHFPGHPIVPGVLMVEAIAQSAALLTNLTLDHTAEETLFYFMGVDKTRFKAPVVPGQTVDLTVQLVKTKASIYWFDGQASVEGDVVAQTSFMAKFMLKETAND